MKRYNNVSQLTTEWSLDHGSIKMYNKEIERILDSQSIRAADLAIRMEQGRIEGMSKVRASQDALRASMERGEKGMAELDSAMDAIRLSNAKSRQI